MIRLLLPLIFFSTPIPAADWFQGSSASGNFSTESPAPTHWSVVNNENIRWKLTLPETGQSTPVIASGKVYFSTLKEVAEDSSLGKDIIAWCVDEKTGEVVWKRELQGRHPLRLSGCFSDSSSPPAVCDGERVVFINASSGIACFDLDGNPVWKKEILSVGRTLPFLHEGNLIFTRQIYPPEPDGNFPHKYADSPKEMWTQLQAIDMKSGEPVWTTECGLNMGCAILPQRLLDGRAVAAVGRGGGHGPPEKPDGISLVDLSDGSTIWTLPLEKFMATMSYRIRNDVLPVFHQGEHLCLDATTGEITSRSSIINEVPVRLWNDGQRVIRPVTIPDAGKGRMITQTSNLLVGKWHYFRSYKRPWLGRVDIESGAVEYLELPLQLSRVKGEADQLLWYVEPASKKEPKLEQQVFVNNDMKNSRGFVVFGDKRSKGSGWGHIASPTPSVAGDHLYVPVMNGTVYVIRWNAETLDESAVVAINDLGPVGQSYTRAGLSFSDGAAFAHTIRELICIGE
ncbi:MAG: PQQ-binding-like beta-propeller repeat protein [Verrucomicrobiales bacterium]|nr:PQQ-binding-like beta-propeller repeat protein [Verrucomicrobiales bacterium]